MDIVRPILIDTSVWIDHLQTSSLVLTQLLEEDRVLTHPFVLGELMLSGLVNREEINISTLEDPIEYRLPGINLPVNSSTIKTSFSRTT